MYKYITIGECILKRYISVLLAVTRVNQENESLSALPLIIHDFFNSSFDIFSPLELGEDNYSSFKYSSITISISFL